MSLNTLLNSIKSRLARGERRLLVGTHNLHSLYLCQSDAEVQTFYRQCQTCYIDGMGALWLLRAAGLEVGAAGRFSLMDCLPALFDWAEEQQVSLFYIGASPLAVARAREWSAMRWPKLRLSLHHGYLTTPELQQGVVDNINLLRPDILLVGMGMPKQEAWINAHIRSLDVGAILQAGGTLDYYTGVQRRPPRLLSRLGLAWLYRLLCNPRRLWHRYLVTPWLLIRPACRLRRALHR
ncbi:MAG: WecB/TagA/CpsF family glycosyltransferase [Chromatocurvus sp.]